MSICWAERRDVTSTACQLAGNHLANAGADRQASLPQPADNPPKKPGKNRHKLFDARSGF
ncbi:hypothetical protein OAT72_02290 [Alphaproteobacteria bacterium]|nr:hypothetical protein [Alphaproteobacteria bacterium]